MSRDYFEYAFENDAELWKLLAVMIVPTVEVTDRQTIKVSSREVVRFRQMAHDVNLSYIPAVWLVEHR